MERLMRLRGEGGGKSLGLTLSLKPTHASLWLSGDTNQHSHFKLRPPGGEFTQFTADG